MEKLHAMFHGTDVYINGKYKYSSNEILTAYLNLNLSVEELTEWLFQLKAELRDLKLRVDFSDEERFVVQLLGAHPEGFHINALAVETGMPINRLSATLFELELRGIVRPLAGNCFKVIS